MSNNTIGFITPNTPTVELMQYIEAFKNRNVTTENIFINVPFKELIASIEDNSTLMLVNYQSVFSSITDFFSLNISLAERNIYIKTLDDILPITTKDDIELFKKLQRIETIVRGTSTKKGLEKVKAAGKKLGRPFGTSKISDKVLEAVRLRNKYNISAVKACEMAGCQPRSYYTYIKNTKQE